MERDGSDPQAPHWFDFNKLNELPNDWAFEVLEWDDDPDPEGIDDRGKGEVVRGEHRFVITTLLKPRERTADRYWTVSYEAVNQDGEDEPPPIHAGRSSTGARNGLGHARTVLDDGDTDPHVLVRDHNDGPRETFEFPAEYLAEQAADIQVRARMDDDDRDYLITVHSKGDWEDQLELERSIAEDGGRR